MLQLTSTITENATIEIGLRDIEVPNQVRMRCSLRFKPRQSTRQI